MLSRTSLLALPILATLFSSGCATVISGRTAQVAMRSNPPEARVTVRDPEGTVVAQTITPGMVELKRGRSWLRPASYEAIFEKPGYATASAPIRSKFNPWTIGNLALGGGLGAGVDLATGAVWKPKHGTIEQSLASLNGSNGYGAPYASNGNQAPPVQMASGTEPVSNQTR